MEPNIALVASLIGDHTRSKMLAALMGGKALTATELALEADITPQTASSHLAKLVEGQLLIARKQGRHKYFQLKDAKVAELIEALLNIAVDIQPVLVKTGPTDLRLSRSRVCYDHLAGELGVSLYESLIENSFIIEACTEVMLSEKGKVYFQKLGVNFEVLQQSKRPLCKSCLDWSERRSHLSGSLGKWIYLDILKQGWARKDLDSRAVQFSKNGLNKFVQVYKIVE